MNHYQKFHESKYSTLTELGECLDRQYKRYHGENIILEDLKVAFTFSFDIKRQFEWALTHKDPFRQIPVLIICYHPDEFENKSGKLIPKTMCGAAWFDHSETALPTFVYKREFASI